MSVNPHMRGLGKAMVLAHGRHMSWGSNKEGIRPIIMKAITRHKQQKWEHTT